MTSAFSVSLNLQQLITILLKLKLAPRNDLISDFLANTILNNLKARHPVQETGLRYDRFVSVYLLLSLMYVIGFSAFAQEPQLFVAHNWSVNVNEMVRTKS